MIAPRWTQFRVGPYLRRERDKREYQRLFHDDGYVSGPRRLALTTFLPKVLEGQSENTLAAASPLGSLVLFRGLKGMFGPLLGQSAMLRSELERITRPQYLPPIENEPPFIGVHVRRGDFRVPECLADLRRGAVNVRIPLAWYVTVLGRLRQALGFEAKAVVFSDGTEEELYDLLAFPGVEFSRREQAITDMLRLAKACALVASGSTFSMWASFLGQVPCVWYPGQRRQLVISQGMTDHLEPEIAERQGLPVEFVSMVRRRWDSQEHSIPRQRACVEVGS